MSDARPAWREAAMVVAAFTGLSLAATFPLVLHLARTLPGDLGDPLFTSWLLGWDADRLRHGLTGFWHAPIMFPSRYTLAFSEHMLGIAVFVAPVIWITGNPILGYNLAFVFTYVLAGSGMYLLARELTGRRDAAFLAGLAFAFGPARSLHISHLHVLASGWMPIALWGLHRYFATQSTAALAVFVAAFTVQALSNGYFLYFLTLAVSFVVVYELVSRPGSRAERARAVARLAAASAIILVFVGAVAFAYLAVRRQYGFRRPYDDWTMFSADVQSYVSAPATLHVWGKWLDGDRAPERQLFPGLVTLILGAAALWPGRARRSVTILYAAIGAVAFVLSLGPEPAAWSHRLLPSGPYLWLTWIVPGMDGLRVPARLSTLVFLALGVLTAIGAARLLEPVSRRGRRAVMLAMGAVILVEGWVAPLSIVAFDPRGRPGDRAAYRWLAQHPPGALLELPIRDWSIAPTLTYQYATLSHGHAIVNGYSGWGSSLQDFLGGAGSPLNDLDRMDETLDMLRLLGVHYVFVHPRDYEDPEVGVNTAAAIRARALHVAEELRVDDVVAFRLRDPETSPPVPTASGTRLGANDFRADASDVPERLPLAFDGDPDTRWLTGRQQSGDEWIRIEFNQPRDVLRIELQTASRSFGDYPRELLVESTRRDGSRSVLFKGGVLLPFGRALATGTSYPSIAIALPSNRTQTLTIKQTGRADRRFWSLHELVLWER